MNNQIQISLAFTADTKQAQMQLQNLQNSLKTLMTASPNLFPDSSIEQVRKAQSAVASLSVALKNATNVDTGKLNLTQFNESLNRSGMSLEQYRKQLQNLGAQGEKAFLQVANSVMSAETAIKRSNKLLDSFWHSLKQTAKYQISAAMFQGVTSGIRSAFNYAEDLNKSLNNIQIVTGKSSEEMARFAQQANKAAKELSATTTEYTDAALIYYQQGDSDALATKKADITIKAANAAGSNAQEMSEYLTAVWNSYDVGEEKLMQYADVMAAIGAGTATSFEEISEAMEKVASVGEATGVKFEQLSSIIATVSSVTRQSASTVGTAFKTIFARMADLELDGKVVEDGVAVTLGDVSEQLEMVGVNVLDVDGNLRDMGTVMEELMAKWDTMNDATRQAVAIAVAGKRQYTQLLALMNNQDMYESSMAMAEGAEGTVDEQAEIYAKSWEASSKRVKAATEGLWDSLLNDEWFIKLNDAFAEIIKFIEKLVDSMGGPIGVFSALGMVLTKVFNQQMVQGIANMTQHLYSMSAAGKQAAESLKMEAINQANTMLDQSKSTGGYVSNEDAAIIETNKIRLTLQKDLMMNAKNMTQEQIQQYQHELDINKAYEERYIKSQALLDQKEKELSDAALGAQDSIVLNNIDSPDDEINTKTTQLNEAMTMLKDNTGEYGAILREAFSSSKIEVLTEDLKKAGEAGTISKKDIIAALDGIETNSEETKKKIEQLKKTLNTKMSDKDWVKLRKELSLIAGSSDKARAAFLKQAKACDVNDDEARKLADAIFGVREAEEQGTQSGEQYKNSIEGIGKNATLAKSGIQQFSQGIVGSFSSISSITMGITSLKSAFDTLSNPDMSTWEKVTSVMMSLGMGIPSLVNGLSSLHANFSKVGQGIGTAIDASYAAIVANTLEEESIEEVNEEKEKEIALGAKSRIAKLGEILGVKMKALASKEEAVAEGSATAAKKGGIIAGLAHVATLISEQLAAWGLNAALAPLVAVILLLVAAIGAAIAIGYVLVKVFEAMSNAYNKDAIAAQEANEQLKRQQEELEKTKDAHEDLISTLDKYKNAYDTLNKMTEGTEEWAKQADELNGIVTDLISKYPELAKFVTMKDGVATISEENLEAFEKESAQKVKNQEINVLEAKRAANRANAQANATALARDGNKIEWWDSSTTASAKTINESVAKSEIQFLQDNYNEEGEEFLLSPEAQNSINQIIAVTDANRNEILELIRTTKELNDTNKILTEQQAAKMFEGNKDYQNSKYKDVINKKAADIIEANSTYTDADWERAEKMFDGSAGEENYTDYLKALYGENYDPSKQRIVDRAGGNVTLQLFNEETQQWETQGEENSISNDSIKRTTAQYYADERAKTEAQKVDPAQINKELTQIENDYTKKGIDAKDAVQIATDIGTGTGIQLGNLSQKTVDKLYELELEKDPFQYAPGSMEFNQIMSGEKTEFAKQIEDFNNKGGVLGANNQSFQDMFNLAQMDTTTEAPTGMAPSEEAAWMAEHSDDAFNEFFDEKEKLGVSYLNNSEIKQAVEEQKQWYAELSAEEQRLAAETIDFKKAINKELLESELENAKEKKAFEGLDAAAEKYEMDAKVLKAQAAQMAKALKATNSEMENSAEIAAEMAVSNQRLNKGVNKLTDNWESWKKTLKSTDKTTADYAEAVVGLNDAVSDILNLTSDATIVPDDFWDNAENIDLMEQIGNGSEEAVDKLGANLLIAQIKSQEMSAEIYTQMESLFDGLDYEGAVAKFDGIKNNLISAVGEMQAHLNTLDPGEPFTGENATNFALALNEYAAATKMTAEQMHDYLSEAGVDAQVTTDVVPTTRYEPRTVTEESIEVIQPAESKTFKDEAGNETTETTPTLYRKINQVVEHTLEPIDAEMEVAQIAFNEEGTAPLSVTRKGRGPITPSATTGGKSSGGSGKKGGSGGGNNSKANKPHEKSEKSKDNKVFRAKTAELEIDRFEDEDRAIEKVQRSLDKLNRTKEEAIGTKYLNALDSENEKLYEQYRINEDIQSQAKKFLSQDLDKARSYGLNIEVDDEGMITNMEDVRTQIIAMENALEQDKINDENNFNIEEDNRLNALLTNDDATNEQRDAVQKDIEDRKKAKEKEYEEREHVIDQATAWFEKYDEEWQKYIDTGVANEEILMQIRANNLEKITYKTEQLIELNEKELGILELMQSRIGESFREAPELFDVINKKYTDITDKGMIYVDQLEEAKEKFAEGAISEAGYFELLNSSYDGLSDAISSLIEYAEEMDDVMLNAFEDFNEELDTANSGFEHLISLTENYESLMELMGKNTDKELLSGLYKQRGFIAETAYQSSIQDYQWYVNEYTKVKTAYDTAIAEGREGEAEKYVDELEMLKEQVHDKQLTMLDNAQQWAESMVAIRDVALEAAAETMQKALFGDMSKDQFDEYMGSLKAKTEDYLTETNQQYETQKMIRTAIRDIEKTENEAAKRKLENFKKETAELQKQSKLSNFELEVQQAKYDLLLAEIALQEAQDAKSTVRLRRDAEGNFNYVYTADQDKVADAEQKYADAENNLYNIRLEGANEYAEKQVQIQQELADKLIEIWTNTELTEEERDARIAALKEDYYSRLENAQEVYNIAAEGLSDNLNEAWTTDMMDNIASVGEFKTYTTQYVSECETAFGAYQKEVDRLSKLLEANYGDVEEGARKVKEEVDDVREQGTIDLNALWLKTSEWARNTGSALDTTIAKWQELLEKIIEAQRLTTGFDTDINYMARYQESTTVTGAFQELLKRDRKTEMLPGQWDENVEELMKEVNDQSAIMMNADSLSEVFAAASRREAKLAWIKQEDLGLYEELISQIDSTEKIMKEMYEKLGYGDKFESNWKEILDGLAKLPKMYENFNKDIIEALPKGETATGASFDTGGYTGSWGSDGKYAMLHEKELILNENDTQNLLDTVDIVRDLIDSFEYNNLINSIAGLKPISIESVGGGDFLEQEVTIHAEFPNVQDKHEIEDAIENLVLTASQFANRKS